MVVVSPTETKPASRPSTMVSTSSGLSTGTRVTNWSPDCITEPTLTGATLSTMESRSARSSTRLRRSRALFRFSLASASLRPCSVRVCEDSVLICWA